MLADSVFEAGFEASLSKFATLPIEILQRICEQLEDLLPFGLVSKKCRIAVCPMIYANIRLVDTGIAQLHSDVAQWVFRLQSNQAFPYPRRLELTTKVYLDANNHDDPAGEDLHIRWRDIRYRSEYTAWDKQHEYWKPIADLIDRLPGLIEVSNACDLQVAPCVLEAIERKPNCHFSLDAFHVKTLLEPTTKTPPMTSHEAQLVTSAHLRRMISSRFLTAEDGRQLNLMRDIVRTMASRDTSALREVSLCYHGNTASFLSGWKSDEVHQSQLQSTESKSQCINGSKISLDCLELCGEELCTTETLDAWQEVVDFSKLKQLKLRDRVGVEIMKWLTSAVELKSLRSLTLVFLDYEHAAEMEGIPRGWEAPEAAQLAVQLAKQLQPLRSLQISGSCEPFTLYQILNLQGRSLEELIVTPSHTNGYDYVDTGFASWDCPMVKDLRTVVHRSIGDMREIAQYDWIGRTFPNVRRVSLLVDCSHYGPQIKDMQEILATNICLHKVGDATYDLRHTLRNSAIDQALAEAIFRAIASSKPTGSPQLERLELRIWHGTSRGRYPTGFWRLCRLISTNWVCTASAQSNWTDSVLAKAVPTFRNEPYPHVLRECEEAKAIFQTIWPKKIGYLWHDSWHSTPLTG